jgi:apolipoprotein N-acyltransferase
MVGVTSLDRRVWWFIRPAVAAGSGVAVWLSFPPVSWWFAAVLGVAGFTLACRVNGRRRAFVTGWAFGLGLLVPMLAFLRGIGVDAWLVLAVSESLWFGLLAVAAAAGWRRPWSSGCLPLLWVAQEWLRDRVPFGGFPWARLGFGQASGPLLPWAAVGGATALTLAVAGLGQALVWLLTGRGLPWRWRLPAVLAGALAVVLGALAVPVPTDGTSTGGPRSVTVAAVQGNVPRLGLEEFAQARAVTRDHLAETQRLAAAVAAGSVPRPQLVIWPENASDFDPFHDPTARALIDRAVAAAGVPVLVGAVLDGPGPHHVQNAAIVWSPDSGPGARYVKRHLVPFGEYLPFRSLLTRLIGRFALIPRDFAPGHRPGVLQVGPARVADVICFEVADDGVVRQAVDGGGRLLVVQTNNATYERVGDNGDGGETAQQLEMSRVRAVEHGRAVVVAATSGVSAIVSPSGRVLQQTGVFVPAYLVATVPLRDGRTLADRLGPWPERALALAGALVLIALAGEACLRRRRRPAAEGEAQV